MFKVGDKVRRIDHSDWPHLYGRKGEVYEVLDMVGSSPVVIAGSSGASSSSFELVEEKKEMTHKYNEGQWYAWDGKGTCPLHPEDEFTTLGLDGSKNGYHNNNPKGATQYRSNASGCWDWNCGRDNEVNTGYAVVAFYITKKYKEPETVEMTVEEICKALGKNIKVVK